MKFLSKAVPVTQWTEQAEPRVQPSSTRRYTMLGEVKRSTRRMWLVGLVAAMTILIVVTPLIASDTPIITNPSFPTFPTCNSQFDGPTLSSPFAQYNENKGAEFSLATRPGFLRFTLPGNRNFDHWERVDDAPQLRCPAPSGNWEMTTQLSIDPRSADDYHAGLMVVFGQFDIIYFGIYSGGGRGQGIGVQRTGEPMRAFHSVGFPRRLVTIDLTIRRDVSRGTPVYHFSYRLDGVEWRILKLGWEVTKVPQYVGLIAKTWRNVRLVVDFDFLRVTKF